MPRIPPWFLLVLLVLYVLSPIDLIPDLFGLPGRLDDLLVSAAGVLYLYQMQRRRPAGDGSRGARRPRGGGSASGEKESGESGFRGRTARPSGDPYEVLGSTAGMPLEEIRRLYKEQLLRYHPDRVEHLGRELQELAEQKTKELNAAFAEILRKRGEKV